LVAEALLLTGGTGFVGRSVLARVLERTDRHVIALVRADDDVHACARLAGVLDGLVAPECAAAGRVHAFAADLSDLHVPTVLGRIEAAGLEVDEVVHSAACVSFDQSLADARHVNVRGTANMLALSRALHEQRPLRRHAHVSTAYVAGDREGIVLEDEGWVGQGFRNTYEQSKLEAEELVRRETGLPVQVLRPSIVVGEAQSGWTSAFNVLYVPLRALASGGMTAVPRLAGGAADVVPVDYVADAVLELADAPADGQTYHLTAGEQAVDLDQLVEITCRAAGRPAPPIVDREEFRHHVGGSGPARLLLAHLDAYLPYMDVRARFDAARSHGFLAERGVEVPALESYLPALLEFANATRWGRAPISRVDARASAVVAAA
jgi:long-chain acyl-CoA synthetase